MCKDIRDRHMMRIAPDPKPRVVQSWMRECGGRFSVTGQSSMWLADFSIFSGLLKKFPFLFFLLLWQAKTWRVFMSNCSSSSFRTLYVCEAVFPPQHPTRLRKEIDLIGRMWRQRYSNVSMPIRYCEVFLNCRATELVVSDRDRCTFCFLLGYPRKTLCNFRQFLLGVCTITNQPAGALSKYILWGELYR